MDRFVRVTPAKKPQVFSAPVRFYANEPAVAKIRACIADGGGAVVCVHGPSGSGKTFAVNHLARTAENVARVTAGDASTATLPVATELLDRLALSTSTLTVVDMVDVDSVIFKAITDRANAGMRFGSGCFVFVVTGCAVKSIEHCTHVEFSAAAVNTLVDLGRLHRRGVSLPLNTLVDLGKRARGNIRDFMISLEFSDVRDEFRGSKSLIHDMVCANVKYPKHPGGYIGQSVEDHGYSWGIIHENFLDAATLSVSCMADITDWMSTADTIDSLMYTTQQDLYDIFSLYAVVMPAIRINHALVETAMRPGSAWTKFSNYRMRSMRLRHLKHSSPAASRIDVDSVDLIIKYCTALKLDAVPILQSYRLQPHDLDLMNHFVSSNKLKPRLLSILKKKLNEKHPV